MSSNAAPMGHNNPPPDHVPMLDAIGRQRWALMDPRNPLSAIQRGIGQVIVNHIEAFGEGVKLSYEYLAGCAGLTNRESARYHTEGILKWMGFHVERETTRSSYRWSTNITPEQHVEIYLANLKRKGPSVRPEPDKKGLSDSPRLTEYQAVSPALTKLSADGKSVEIVRPNLTHDNPSVRHASESVRPGTPRNYNSSSLLPASDSNVVSESITGRLKPFGEHGVDWAQELAQFFGETIPIAVDRMEKAARTYGHFNVVEAIREAIGTSNVKSPAGLFGSILNRQLREHGKRDEMPKPKLVSKGSSGDTYLPLTMRERIFYC